MPPNGPVDEQLSTYAEQNKGNNDVLTTGGGRPLESLTNTQTAGPRGPVLVQDKNYLEHMTAFDRERIPERVVHAKGYGAFGFWENTTDEAQKYCKAAMFKGVGKRTPMVARFSTVGGETGTPDTARDPRGFSLKFYTEEGNWDMVGNNTPIFFVRDPILFPSFIHTQKRNPVTHMKDANMFWDFLSLMPQSVHQTTILFSDRGTPYSARFMNGYGSHTFKNVNDAGEAVYVKYHFKTDQGIKNLSADKAAALGGSEPDFSTKDLYNAIANGEFPSWTAYIQVMSLEHAKNSKENPFDVTKVWSHKEFPLIEIGRFTLNKNPENYFTDVEQAAYDPSNFIPGIEPSPDKMLQGRLLSYIDAHRHRLGTNYEQLPINQSVNTTVKNYQRDGPMRLHNQGGAPNYFPNSFEGPQPSKLGVWHVDESAGDLGTVKRYDTTEDDNFSQCRKMYQMFDEGHKDRLTTNIAGHLGGAVEFIQERMIGVLKQVDPDYGQRVADKIAESKKQPEPEPEPEAPEEKTQPLNPPRNVPKQQ